METLATMAAMARSAVSDPAFVERFNQTVGRSLPYTIGDSAFDRLDYFIRGHFRYRGENEEVIRTPQYMIQQLQESGKFEGDCDDVSTMLATIAKVMQWPVRLVAIRYKGDAFEHVFVEVYDGQRWNVFDPTVQRGTDYKELERMTVAV